MFELFHFLCGIAFYWASFSFPFCHFCLYNSDDCFFRFVASTVGAWIFVWWWGIFYKFRHFKCALYCIYILCSLQIYIKPFKIPNESFETIKDFSRGEKTTQNHCNGFSFVYGAIFRPIRYLLWQVDGSLFPQLVLFSKQYASLAKRNGNGGETERASEQKITHGLKLWIGTN